MTTLEWFGATTFRIKTCGLTIFHDAWLEKPTCLQQSLKIDEVDDVDYIFISHAHFDHIIGADKLAKRTNAIVIGNCEAINVLRKAGVPSENLIAVSGGERVPLFTRDVREKAQLGQVQLAGGPPAAPRAPHESLAALTVHVWPSLHALLPAASLHDLPPVFDSGAVYSGETSHECTLDITRMMTHGLLQFTKPLPDEVLQHLDADGLSFAEWMRDPSHVFSGCDGGQLIFNFLIGEGKTLLFNGQLGAYEGIMRGIKEKPTVAVLALPGRANLNGRPFNGSSAQFLALEAKWLGEPERVIWCLHDPLFVNPKRTDTRAAKELVESTTKSKVWDLEHAQVYPLFE